MFDDVIFQSVMNLMLISGVEMDLGNACLQVK